MTLEGSRDVPRRLVHGVNQPFPPKTPREVVSFIRNTSQPLLNG